MKIGIMQPYVFPYIGYYQLISAVDNFVFLDDVNYIKRGWINRNNIVFNGKEHMFTIPIANASLNRRINEHSVSQEYDIWKKNFYKTIELSYKRSTYYDEVIELIKSSLDDKNTILQISVESIKNICNYLDIKTCFEVSSKLKITSTKEQRILDICKKMSAKTYINPLGGQLLYDKIKFRINDVDLYFLKTNSPLKTSIIDVLMNHGKFSKNLLQDYILV